MKVIAGDHFGRKHPHMGKKGDDGFRDIALRPGMDSELVKVLCQAGWRQWRNAPRRRTERVGFWFKDQPYVASMTRRGLLIEARPRTALCLRWFP
jgi:hypothetical protein